jgi:hypothetical protein
MIIDEVALAAEATDAQDAGHGALAGGQDGAEEQDLGMAPGAVTKQRRKGYNDRGEAGGQVQHGGVSWRKLRQPTTSFASPPALPNTYQKWPNSSLEAVRSALRREKVV